MLAFGRCYVMLCYAVYVCTGPAVGRSRRTGACDEASLVLRRRSAGALEPSATARVFCERLRACVGVGQ